MAASAARIAEVLASLRAQTSRLCAASDLAAISSAVATAAAAPRRAEQLPSGIAALDLILGGGLVRGRICEIVGRRSSGRLSVALSVLASAQEEEAPCAMVDVADGLDPESAARAGVSLERLLWVRPREIRQGLIAVDRLLEVGGFALVLLHLSDAPASALRDVSWVRLARRVEASGSVLLVVSDHVTTGAASSLTLETSRTRARWDTRPRTQLFDGSGARIRVLRRRASSAQPVPAHGDEARVELSITLPARDT